MQPVVASLTVRLRASLESPQQRAVTIQVALVKGVKDVTTRSPRDLTGSDYRPITGYPRNRFQAGSLGVKSGGGPIRPKQHSQYSCVSCSMW
jgi:hypothetical protein